MNIKRILKRILHLPTESELEFLEKHGFKHGKNFHFFSGSPIDSNFPWLITVGDNVMLATDTKILAHDASTSLTGAHTKIGTVTIGNNVFIGARSIVLCNTKIGDNVIIGANSVVTKSLPSNGVYAGNPAKYICSFDEYQAKHKKNLETHVYFNQRAWNDWINAAPEEWDSMKHELQDTFGYV